MRRLLFSGVLALILGILALSQGYPAFAASTGTTTATAALIAQEPNQDNLEMTCNGSIAANNTDYTVFFTRAAGFSRIALRRANGQPIAETFLNFDQQNDQGQAIWRGAVNDMASVTLIHLADRPAQPGDQVSVNYDGQWGRGTCR
jgi:hypothetical protein